MHDIVRISHVDSPSQFWVQKGENIDLVSNLQKYLKKIAGNLPPSTNLEVGKLCVAKYWMDSQWYRALILNNEDNNAIVRYIDYGKTDVFEINKNPFKQINCHLKEMKHLATKCSLLAAPVDGNDWSENACKEFEEFTKLSSTFKQNVLFNKETYYYVELVHNAVNITEQLISNGHAILCNENDINNTSVLCSDSDVLTKKQTGYISHFLDLNEFYVQLECDRAALEFLEDALSDAVTFPVCKNPKEGMACVAQFSDDMLWYRATILKVLPNSYEVFFMDYGNVKISHNIKNMPTSLEYIGQLAKQCYIFIPDDLETLKCEIGQKLQEISRNSLKAFEIEFQSLCTPYKTQLILNGENIIEKILLESYDDPKL